MPLVAVYGSLRKGFGNGARCLPNMEPIGTHRIEGYVMYSLGGFPVVYRAPVSSSIVVEVYEVTQERLEGPLDRLESHPSWYKRELVETPSGEAWLYIMTVDYTKTAPHVESGDWTEYNKRGL